MSEKEKKPLPSTLDDIESGEKAEIQKEDISYEERVAQVMEKHKDLEPCTFDKQKEEKIKKYSFYAVVPLLLLAIVLTVTLKSGPYMRSPYGFFVASAAFIVMSVATYLRMLNIKKCTCKVCETQYKSVKQSFSIWAVITVIFVVFSIVNVCIKIR